MKVTLEQLRPEVFFKAVRSRGPGGQNVNKVSSAAILYWEYLYSRVLNETAKARITEKLTSLINSENQIFVRADEFRDLERNKSRCLEKLADAVNEALHIPKKRRPTKPTRGSVRRRMESKSKRGDLKKSRRNVKHD